MKQKKSASGAQRRTRAWPTARAAAASPSGKGARGDGGAEHGGHGRRRRGPRAGGAKGAAAGAAEVRLPPGAGPRLALPPRTCVGVSPAQPRSQQPSAPNLLNSKGGPASRRKEGQAAAGTAWRGRQRRAHLAQRRRPARKELRFGPNALRKSPHRRRRGSATAHHVPPRSEAAAAHGVPPRCGAGRAGGALVQAVDRRNRPAAAALAAAATEGARTGAGST